MRTIFAVFKGVQQTKEAVEEIQRESLANSYISVIVRSDYVNKGDFHAEIANELANFPAEKNLDKFNAWLIQGPPIDIENLGECLVAGPLARSILNIPKGQGLPEALLPYGISSERARYYEHKVRTGHFLVVISTEQEKANEVANALQSFGGRDVEKWNKNIDHSLYVPH